MDKVELTEEQSTVYAGLLEREGILQQQEIMLLEGEKMLLQEQLGLAKRQHKNLHDTRDFLKDVVS